MTTITTAQLDELEAAARKARTDRPRDPFEIPGHWWRLTPDVTLSLVSIARAALAWSEARDALALNRQNIGLAKRLEVAADDLQNTIIRGTHE